jgi:hypothetical protein
VWLRSFGVTTKQVDEALAAQRSTGMRLGAQLIALGHATSEMVLEALARQSGADFVPHVDPAVVRHAPGGLSPHAVRALSLVPITRPEGGRIRVACAAPVPRVALAAFSRITSLVPEPCVVTDAVYEALVDAYGADATRQETAEFVSTQDLGEAVRHIAAAALGDRSSQLTETRLAPLTWVRVRGEHGVHDVVLNEQLKEA